MILHTVNDNVVHIDSGRHLAANIAGAKLLELKGDHVPYTDDADIVAGEIEEFLTGSRHDLEADRVLATVMFTDIVGATEKAASLSDRRWRDLLESHHRIVRTELARQRGKEVDTAGDGFLATFDGPARAVRCACAISDAVRSLGVAIAACAP